MFRMLDKPKEGKFKFYFSHLCNGAAPSLRNMKGFCRLFWKYILLKYVCNPYKDP